MAQTRESVEALTARFVALLDDRDRRFSQVARFLHDDLGQVLSAVGLQLGVLRLDFGERVPELTGRIEEIQEILEQAMARVRDLSFELNPGIVEKAGLNTALDRLVGRYRSGFPGSLRLLFDSSVRLPLAAAIGVYKIAGIALENAVRHSQASQIEVMVKPHQGGVMVEVRDNGKGFDVAQQRIAPPSLGLSLMQHYAGQAGLNLQVRSSPGKGTAVKALHPPSSPG